MQRRNLLGAVGAGSITKNVLNKPIDKSVTGRGIFVHSGLKYRITEYRGPDVQRAHMDYLPPIYLKQGKLHRIKGGSKSETEILSGDSPVHLHKSLNSFSDSISEEISILPTQTGAFNMPTDGILLEETIQTPEIELRERRRNKISVQAFGRASTVESNEGLRMKGNPTKVAMQTVNGNPTTAEVVPEIQIKNEGPVAVGRESK